METIKNRVKSFFSVGPKSTFIILILIIICLCVIYNMKKTITVVIDGKETEIVTFTSSLRSSLEKSKIVVSPKDKISVNIDSKVKDGDKVYIKKASQIEVVVDGRTYSVSTAESSIGDMLQAEGITVSDYDRVSPLKTDSLSEGMKVSITRVSSEVVKTVENIDFPTVVQKDENLVSTVTKIVQEGQAGERQILNRVVYEDGKEVSRQVISDSVTKNPIQRVVVQGTLGILNLSRGGDQILYKNVIKVKSTAYCSCYQCTGKFKDSKGYAITASGNVAKRNPDGYSTIAVDPRIIPLGTKVYVEGYGFAIAEDTGGAIKGNIIDLYFNSHSESLNWGVQYKNVYILK